MGYSLDGSIHAYMQHSQIRLINMFITSTHLFFHFLWWEHRREWVKAFQIP